MVLLFFVLDLRCLPPPLLEELKQCLLQQANLYAICSTQLKNRKNDLPIEDSIGLCYLRQAVDSPSDEVKIAYSPRGRDFSLRDFHYAVNHLPSDSYAPSLLDDSGSFLFHDIDFSRIFNDGVLYSIGDKDIERKVILISSCLVGNVDSCARDILMEAAERCVSVEFVFFEQKSSQLGDISEIINKFKGQICDLENCSFNAYLPDTQAFNGLVKRWYKYLKEGTENILQAHLVFQRSITGSINQISCRLCCSINQIMDVFNPSKTCRCSGILCDGTDVCACKKCLSCHSTRQGLGPDDTDKNLVTFGASIEASWRNSIIFHHVSSAIAFNVIERTSLDTLSEGVLVGQPFIVLPSVNQDINTAPDESEKCQLNNQLFHGLSHALYSLNQGLVCWSFCDIETMQETVFCYYYILQPSDSGLLLLRRLAGEEEILPFPDINLSDSFTAEEFACSIQQCLQEVKLRDYNPVQHSGGFHQKLNELVANDLQSGLAASELTNVTSNSTFHDSISSQSSLMKESIAPQGETHPSAHTDECDKGIGRITQEWEQLVVGDIPKIISSSPSEPNTQKSISSPPTTYQKPLDTRTSNILKRLGNPKQMKIKVTSSTEMSGKVGNTSGITVTNQPVLINNADRILVTSSQLMKPTFHRLKRKYR